MAGFLPSWLAIPLTKYTGYRVDFSFFGQTSLNQGIGSYSRAQIVQRLYIWGGIFAGAAVGGYLRQQFEEDSGAASLALSIGSGAMAGLLLTHSHIMMKKVFNRLELIDEATLFETNITRLCNDMARLNPNFPHNNITLLCQHIQESSKSTATDARASYTLLNRKNLMQSLYHQLESDSKQYASIENQAGINIFWHQPIGMILAHLEETKGLGVINEKEERTSLAPNPS